MESFGRQPPRFVPTLTDVVPLGLPLHKPAQQQEPVMDDFLRPDVEPAHGAGNNEADVLQPSPGHSPQAEPDQLEPEPAFTEEVSTAAIDISADEQPWSQPNAVQINELQTQAWDLSASVVEAPERIRTEMDSPSVSNNTVDLEALQETLVARILARVQPQLEAHLREVVADVVSHHTEAMARSLHHAVEDVVRQTVSDAMEQEKIQAKLGFDAYP